MKEGIFSHRRWAPIVAALLIFAMVGTGTWVYATPAYEISVIDEKDGSEFLFRVNKVNKVIGVITDEREEDYEPIDPEIYEGKDINEAIIEMIEFLEDEYDENYSFEDLVITAKAKNKEESDGIAKSLQERMDEYWEEMEMEEAEEDNENNESEKVVKEDRIPKVKGLSDEDLDILDDYSITPGKLNIVKNLMYIEYKERDEDYVRKYLEKLERDLDDDEDLSKKIMEDFSARNGEKNNPSVNAPGQEDKEKKEKDTPPGLMNKMEEGTTLRESRELDSDNDDRDGDAERPDSPGKSNSAPGKSK